MPLGTQEVCFNPFEQTQVSYEPYAAFLNTLEHTAEDTFSAADTAYDVQEAWMGLANDSALIALDSSTPPMSFGLSDIGFFNINASASLPSSTPSSGDALLEEATLLALSSVVSSDGGHSDDPAGGALLLGASQNEPRSEQRSWHTSRLPGLAIPRSLGAICPECSQTLVTSSRLK